MIVQAPAKINLNLEILGKREDGFHELRTLMTPVPSLSDTLTFLSSDDFSLTCDVPGVPTDETNLVTKAVRLFERETGTVCRQEIRLEKVIPHGAGLGGGSSDAASALMALNQIYESGLSVERMGELLAEIGSDTSFFAYESAAWCDGRGEKVRAVSLGLRSSLVLIKPAFSVSTPTAFKALLNSVELPGVPYQKQSFGGLELFNDLERPVFQKHLFLAEVKRWLLAQEAVQAAIMSGSGSTMFALVSSSMRALEIAKAAKDELDPTLWTHVGELDV